MDIRIKRAIAVINFIIDDLGFDNPKQFSDSLGFDRPERIYKILRGKTAISRNLAEVINKKYPKYDYNWLLTGEGERLKSGSAATPESNMSGSRVDPDLATVRNEIRGDLKVIVDGMTKNFEVISEGVLAGLKDQRKILDFIEKLDPEEISSASKRLNAFLNEHRET